MAKSSTPVVTPMLAEHPVLKRINAKAAELASAETDLLLAKLNDVLIPFGNIQVKIGESYISLNPANALYNSAYAWGTVALAEYRKARTEVHCVRLSEELMKHFLLV